MTWSPQQEEAIKADARKACSACGEPKALLEFPPDRRARDGRQAKCRACINSWMKDHYRRRPAEHMIRRAKQRSALTGIPFGLTVADITPLPEVCPVFGTPLRISEFAQDPNAYSLDRVDNTRGYVPGNVVVMSYRANRLKNDGTAEEHETIAAWMRLQEAKRECDEALARAAADQVVRLRVIAANLRALAVLDLEPVDIDVPVTPRDA